jgi:hypothetical protein
MPLYLASPFDRIIETSPGRSPLGDPAPGIAQPLLTLPGAKPPGDVPVPAPTLVLLPSDPRKASELRRHFADLWYILVKAGAFLGAIYLAVLGLPLLAFLMLAGGDPERLFLHLGNLSAHYLAADHARRALFAGELTLGFFGLATFAAIWRLPAFLDDVATGLSEDRT